MHLITETKSQLTVYSKSYSRIWDLPASSANSQRSLHVSTYYVTAAISRTWSSQEGEEVYGGMETSKMTTGAS